MYNSNKLSNHFWLRFKGAGACSELRGNVGLKIVFVSSPTAPWDERSRNEFLNIAFEARDLILENAKRYGVSLDLTVRELTMNVPAGQEYNFVPYLPSFFHRQTLAQAQEYYKGAYGCDQVPIVFVINANGRSYAQADRHGDRWIYDETSVIYRPFYAKAFVHELLHQFGARDYYFPDWLKALATKYAPTSIMLNSSCCDIDEVSAYLIGWTNSLSERSLWFLEQTLCITEESHRRAVEAEWKKTTR